MSETSLLELLEAGESGLCPALVGKLPPPWRTREQRGAGYDLDDAGLVAAIKAALLLGQPLIVAGEPGVGKTALADALAARLDLFFHDPVQVKSTTTGLDLFYGFDEVARFRDATRGGAAVAVAGSSSGGPSVAVAGSSSEGALALAGGSDGVPAVAGSSTKGLRDYVRFSSLGRAILWSAGPETVVALGSVPAHEILGYGPDVDTLTLGQLFPSEFDVTQVSRSGTVARHQVGASRRSVVLLDELDKAPRDSPNDVLGELETLGFRIGELDLLVRASPKAWPVVLITSNSERSLPDAFLRRCVFHWIDFPTDTRLEKIAAARCAAAHEIAADAPLVKSAVKCFVDLRSEVENKPPSTAEMIAFLASLIEFGFADGHVVDPDDPRVRLLFGTMVKTRIDRHKLGLTTQAER